MARASVPQRRAPIENPNVTAIIPALNEEASIGKTVRGIIDAAPSGLNQVIVADNGSTDRTAQIAREAGAVVVHEAERGYGAACLAGLAALPAETDVILFMDADLSDLPEEAQSLIDPIISGDAQMVIGSRALGKVETGAMTAPQRLGNWLAPTLVRAIWGVRYTDLGPFRAIERRALDSLAMADRDFGWTIEMQVRAAKTGLRVAERPVSYRRRVGQSKISGTIRGVFAAGAKILFVIAREAFGDFGAAEKRKRPVTITNAAPQSQV
ncbi:glycosyltransferase [Erythrobacter sp. KMU-140]|uniref:Glycosyltransferase n=2 Tax=Erythrobacter rubeus TaxID=2760803 RepID=A0ABR8KPT0_9SPHN|nr:glycosyltransferase [Erythrobacter rubeus]